MKLKTNQITYVSAEVLSPEKIYRIAELDSAIPAEYDPLYQWDRKTVTTRVDLFLNLSKPHFFEVAMVGKEIVGFHIMQKINFHSTPGAGITTLWTHPNFRGQGIARELKERGIKWARENKLEFIHTSVNKNNPRMQEINRNNGYEEFATVFRMKLSSSGD